MREEKDANQAGDKAAALWLQPQQPQRLLQLQVQTDADFPGPSAGRRGPALRERERAHRLAPHGTVASNPAVHMLELRERARVPLCVLCVPGVPDVPDVPPLSALHAVCAMCSACHVLCAMCCV